MKKAYRFLLTASIVLATAFTFSCSGDDGGSSNITTCGGKEYDPTVYSCERNEIVGSCMGQSFYPEYQHCENGQIADGAAISSSSGGMSSSGGDDTPGGGISNLSDLPLSFDGELTGKIDVFLLARYGSDEDRYDTLPAGWIENGRLSLSLPQIPINNNYRYRSWKCDNCHQFSVVPQGLTYLDNTLDSFGSPSPPLVVNIPGRICFIFPNLINETMSWGMAGLVYNPASGTVTGTRSEEVFRFDFSLFSYSVYVYKVLNLNLSQDWQFVYVYRNGDVSYIDEDGHVYATEYWVTDLPAGTTLEWELECAIKGELISGGSSSSGEGGQSSPSGGDSSSSVSLCGSQPYEPATHFCFGGAVTPLCGGQTFTSSQFCYNNSKVGEKCGNMEVEYDPDLYECKPSINPNGIYLKSKPKDADGKEYEAVLIGNQMWMAENLNYAVEGSKCYDNDPANCNTYGRLYDWSTAMAVCPAGWHLPTQAEWEVMMNYSDWDAKKLKATSGWNSYNGVSGNGTDDYGFSALPGGCGSYSCGYYNFDDGFSFVALNGTGYFSSWWSASEYCLELGDSVCSWFMAYDIEETRYQTEGKSSLVSVRCVRD